MCVVYVMYIQLDTMSDIELQLRCNIGVVLIYINVGQVCLVGLWCYAVNCLRIVYKIEQKCFACSF